MKLIILIIIVLTQTRQVLRSWDLATHVSQLKIKKGGNETIDTVSLPF